MFPTQIDTRLYDDDAYWQAMNAIANAWASESWLQFEHIIWCYVG
jgi:hypothetical protein